MATPIGANEVTSIVNRFLFKNVTDQVYGSNPVTFRIFKNKKMMVTGGTQIEVPIMATKFSALQWYEGYDLLDTSPSDVVKTMAFDWKQGQVPVVIDEGTLIRTDSPDAIANQISLKWDMAKIAMADGMGFAIFNDGLTDPKAITGLKGTVDDGTVLTTYGGLARAGNTQLNSVVNATNTLSLGLLQTVMGGVQKGGRHATLICSRQEQYNRYWGLGAAGNNGQRFDVGPGGADEQLYSAGFTNLLFNGIPWVVDDHVFDGPSPSNSAILMLNEDYITLAVSPRADFYLEPFQKPVNQDAFVGKLKWFGQLICTHPGRQAKLTNVSLP